LGSCGYQTINLERGWLGPVLEDAKRRQLNYDAITNGRDLLAELEQAVLAERERCAKIAEAEDAIWNERGTGNLIAIKIRSGE
jgi:hypothetical protein